LSVSRSFETPSYRKTISMTDRLKDLYYEHYNQFMTWYNAADDVTQIGVIVIASFSVFIIFGTMFISKITK